MEYNTSLTRSATVHEHSFDTYKVGIFMVLQGLRNLLNVTTTLHVQLTLQQSHSTQMISSKNKYLLHILNEHRKASSILTSVELHLHGI